MQNLIDFDPVDFLKINTIGLNEKQITELRTFLNTKIGEYILLDAAEYLSEVQIKEISQNQDAQLILQRLKDMIPDFDQYFKSKLFHFKNDFDKTTSIK